MTRRSTAVVASLALVALTLVVGSTSASASGGPRTWDVVIPYTGGPVTWIPPTGVNRVDAVVEGAQGAEIFWQGWGGLGGRASATLDVVPGEDVVVHVGGAGSGPWGGWNGGGDGGSFGRTYGEGGGGGGASDIRVGGATAWHRVLVGGGGGGGGASNNADPGSYSSTGGAGGGAVGGDGRPPWAFPSGLAGLGGTASAGGAGGSAFGYAPGSGRFGSGGDAPLWGGGGGGGLYGGGAGGSGALTCCDIAYVGPGGGGSGHGPEGTAFEPGVRSGHGEVRLSFVAEHKAIVEATVTGTLPEGGSSPAIEVSLRGLLPGDEAAVSGTPTCATDAGPSSPVGTGYELTGCSGLTSADYEIVYVDGGLEVVDVGPPETVLVSGPSGVTGPEITVELTGTDDHTAPDDLRFECSADATTWGPCASGTASVPTGSWTAYVRAIDEAGNVDPTPLVLEWETDATPPETVVVSPPAPFTTGEVSIELTGSDDRTAPSALRFQCSADEIAWIPCGSATGTLPPGVWDIAVRAVDEVGNVDPTPEHVGVVVDVVAPETVLLAGPADGFSSTFVTFDFTGTDDRSDPAALRFVCTIDGHGPGPCAPGSGSLPVGPHQATIAAVDQAGNVDPTPITLTWEVVQGVPNTTITSAPDPFDRRAVSRFVFSGSDDVTPPEDLVFECSLDAAPYAPCGASHEWAFLAEGEHEVRVRAVDGEGQRDPLPAVHRWRIDRTAPDSTITSGPPAVTKVRSADVSFTGVDETGGTVTFQCSLDGWFFEPCTSPRHWPLVGEGSHEVRVRAVDAAGNVDPSPAVLAWTVDLGRPDTVFTDSYVSPLSAWNVSARFKGTDDDTPYWQLGFECSRDGGPFESCQSQYWWRFLPEGEHELRVRAVDRNGLRDLTPAVRRWVLDRTAPETTITSPPPSTTTDPTVTVAFEGTDDRGGPVTLRCGLDGWFAVDCTSPWTSPPLGPGEHRLVVKAVDEAGNTDATPAAVTWTVEP